MNYKIFGHIKLGIGPKNTDNFIKELKKRKCRCHRGVKAMLDNPVFIKSLTIKKRKVGLVLVSPRELGFTHESTLRKFYEGAQKQELELCSPEVAPQLCLQSIKPSITSGILPWFFSLFLGVAKIPEYLWIATEPINGSIFAVFLRKDICPGFSLHAFGDYSWIDSFRVNPEDLWIFTSGEKD